MDFLLEGLLMILEVVDPIEILSLRVYGPFEIMVHDDIEEFVAAKKMVNSDDGATAHIELHIIDEIEVAIVRDFPDALIEGLFWETTEFPFSQRSVEKPNGKQSDQEDAHDDVDG